jgi:hypothetical protein
LFTNITKDKIMTTSYRIVYSSPPEPVSWFFSPSDEDCGGMVAINNRDGEVVLPLGATLQEGWNLFLRSDIGPGGAAINVQHPDTIASQASSETKVFAGEGKSEIIRGGPNRLGGYIYTITGEVFNTGTGVEDNLDTSSEAKAE